MITIDAALLNAATGCGPGTAQTWAGPLAETCGLFEIDNPRRIAAFLAQVGHESASFKRTVENLNYSAGALVETWPKHFDLVHAVSVAHQPQAIANIVYANRMGNTEPNDGWAYRGRGLIQVTGKGNYEAIRDYLRLMTTSIKGVPDLVALPDTLSEPRWAALSAGAYWDEHDLNIPADVLDLDAITRRINGGTIGSPDRHVRYDRAKKALMA